MGTTTQPSALGAAPIQSRPGEVAPTRREAAFNVAVWILFTALWVAFLAALVFSQGSVNDIWHRLRDLPPIIQGVAWLLFLPVTAGLAIWETAWPLVVRLVLIVGLAWVNVYLFFPWKRQ